MAVERNLGGQTWFVLDTQGDKRSIQTSQLYPRPKKTGTIESHQTGQAWADWRRGLAARGRRGSQLQRERGPQ